MQEFKFALFNAGSEVFFSVLDMPEKWRVEGAGRVIDGVIVQSCSVPQILEEYPYDDDDKIPPEDRLIQVCLWGTNDERDRSLESLTTDTEEAAEIIVGRVRAALVEFARTGAFGPSTAVSEETSGPVTTLELT